VSLFIVHRRAKRARNAIKKRPRIGEYALCRQRQGKFYRASPETLRMTLNEAKAICKERNHDIAQKSKKSGKKQVRMKGLKLCVVPVDQAVPDMLLTDPSSGPQKVQKLVTLADIEKMVKHSESEYLQMKYRGLNDEDMQCVIGWCKANDSNHRFSHFGLTDNNVGDEGTGHLMRADADGTVSLQALFLSSNKIGCRGVRSLAKRITEERSRIFKLGLNYNIQIGDMGAKILADSIVHSKLQVLGLTGCNIGDDGCVALASALRQQNCITRLFLSENRIGDEGVLAMASMLMDTCSANTCGSSSLAGVVGAGAEAAAAAAAEGGDGVQDEQHDNTRVDGRGGAGGTGAGTDANVTGAGTDANVTGAGTHANVTGAGSIASMHASSTASTHASTLLRLGLAQCQYTDTGASALRAAVATNTTLERLCMFGNAGVSSGEYDRLRQTARVS
jgi:hypothetical protein